MDPTDEPLLTDPDRAKLAAIDAAPHPLLRAELVRDYYRDPDRVSRTPRGTIARHVETLAGHVAGLALTLVDPATDAGLTDADRDRLRAIERTPDAGVAVRLMRDYWRAADRSARTSRATLYAHLGHALGLIVAMTAPPPDLAEMMTTAIRAHFGTRLDRLVDLPAPPGALRLCGARAPNPDGQAPYHCTRESGHEGDHVAGIGPWRAGDQWLARWAAVTVLDETGGIDETEAARLVAAARQQYDADAAAAATRYADAARRLDRIDVDAGIRAEAARRGLPDVETTAAALAIELEARADRPLELMIHPMSAFQIAGLLQLAGRHPSVSPELLETAGRVLDGVRQYFAACPTVLAVLELGDDPAHDVPMPDGRPPDAVH